MNIVLVPFWSAFTDAYVKQDYFWMSRMVKRMEKSWLCCIGIGLIMLAISRSVYHIWIGRLLDIPFSLSLFMMILVLCQTFGAIYMFMINGIGHIRIQLIIYVLFALTSWGLFTLSCRIFGLIGVPLIPIIVYLTQGILGRIQLYKIINQTATGMWSK